MVSGNWPAGRRKPLMTPDYRYNITSFEDLQILVGSPQKKFSLNAAICSDLPLRDFLMNQLSAAYSQIVIISFWPYSDDLFDHVREETSVGLHDAVFVSGLDDALASGIDIAELLEKLNSSPPRWKAWFPFPIVFWMSAETAERLRKEARDFWEWMETVYRLEHPGAL